jgi:homoserine kinase
VRKRAFAFAPATVANVAVGFDILGFALEGIGETAEVEVIDEGVIIEPVKGYANLPLDPAKNTAGLALLELIKRRRLDFGFRVALNKQIPIGSGLGGSSTSVVAALTAANALLKKKLRPEEMLELALSGEAVASGARHGDNIGPCLHGGLVYVRASNEGSPRIVPVPCAPKFRRALKCVIVLPRLKIETRQAREILGKTLPLATAVKQTSNLAGFILGCATGDRELLSDCLRDVMIEPQRSKLVPGFESLQVAALKAGAFGCSLSGSGPALFALTDSDASALRIRQAMTRAARHAGLPLAGSWISPIARQGARVLRSGRVRA